MSAATDAKPRAFIPADVLNTVVSAITSQLHEPNRVLIHKIVLVIGVDRARALLQQVLELEAAGGQMTVDGTRRKTAGGLFISLARAQASDAERPRLHQYPKKQRPARQPAEPQPTAPPPPTPAVQAPTWGEVKQLVAQALQTTGEAKTVKLTLSGRPGKVVQQPSCVVVAMQGKAPPTLPKGLPTPPANSAVTWAVFIANQQWTKVSAAITQNADDQLLIEGYPLLDPKSKASVVLATSCKSVLQERAQRAAKQSG